MEDISLSDILENATGASKEHLLSNMELEDLFALASQSDNTLKIFSEKDEESLKLSSDDGWMQTQSVDNGWQSYSTSYEEDTITLLLKGINIEFT